MAVQVIKANVKRPEEMDLSKIFSRLRQGRNITEEVLDAGIKRYITESDPNVTPSEIAISFQNLKKELNSDNMNWKIFVKGLRIIGVDEITVLV
jgi:hypothetical protein